VMPLLGGRITDVVGVRVAGTCFAGVLAAGALLLWATIIAKDLDSVMRFNLMEVSMVIIGLGGESLTVAVKAMLASWFAASTSSPGMGFAVGMVLTFGYGGSAICRWVTPYLCTLCVANAFLLSASVCLVSFVSLILASYLHKKHETEVAAAGETAYGTVDQSSLPGEGRSVFSDMAVVLKLPPTFFLLVLMLAIASGMYASYEVFWVDVLVASWGYSHEDASMLSSWAVVAGCFLVPFSGALYDKYGKRLLGASAGCLILAVSWLAVTGSSGANGIPQLATLGIAVGGALLFGGLWPCVSLMVPASCTGVAFGFMTASQNVALSIALVFSGHLRDMHGHFASTGIFLALLGALACLVGLVTNQMTGGTDGAGMNEEASLMQQLMTGKVGKGAEKFAV